MGIGNTSPSSIWMHLFGRIPLKDCIGVGAGLDDDGIRHKYDVLSRVLCAFPIVDSAVRMMNEMNNFDDAGITKYFR